jgi:hypothetical protein
MTTWKRSTTEGRPEIKKRPLGKAWWPADAKPVITSATRVTICPAPPVPTRTNTYPVY